VLSGCRGFEKDLHIFFRPKEDATIVVVPLENPALTPGESDQAVSDM
jgi:hypothetical protein